MAFTNFDELLGSPAFDLRVNSQKSVRKGKIPWNQIDELVQELFPLGGLTTASHPDFPVMTAKGVNIVPFSRDKSPTLTNAGNLDLAVSNSYDYAEVTIDYSVDSNNIEEEEDPENPDPVLLLNHVWSIGGEFLTIPSDGFEWEADLAEIGSDIDLGILIPMIEHQVTWPRVQSPPFNAIRNTIGKVNSNLGSFRTGTFLEETLLFTGAQLQRDIISTGVLAWEVSYRFSERRVEAASDDNGVASDSTVGGWNHFYRSDDKFKTDDPKVGFYRIHGKTGHTGAGKAPYEKTNFTPLFVEAT